MTFLLWLGSGFAFAVGVCCGVFAIKWASKHPLNDSVDDTNRQSLNALKERNEISREQVEALERIASAIEKAKFSSRNIDPI